jgi:hypothetical protein
MTTNRTLLLLSAWGLLLPAARAEQVVHLDFDFFTDTTSDDGKDYFYSVPERIAIVDTLNTKFMAFPVTFTLVEPTGLFSTVYFNTGLSDAGDVDFQNTKKLDDASVHIPKMMEIATLMPPFAPPDVVTASVNVTAHEVLHLLGTRHHDSFLPIGSGVPTPSVKDDFEPDFPGGAGASLTAKEFNSLTLGLGFSSGKLLDPDLFIGPRSAVKLLHDTFTDVDVDSDDANDILDPQPLTLKTVPIPFTLPRDPMEPEIILTADIAIVEEASITLADPPFDFGPESDYYSFFAKAGDLIHIEVMSKILDYRFSDLMDPVVAILDPAAAYSPVLYFGEPAINDDERESSDSFLFDVPIPATGTYVIEVFPGSSIPSAALGEYEMLVYRINSRVVPEPSSAVLLLLAAATGVGFRRFFRRGKRLHFDR